MSIAFSLYRKQPKTDQKEILPPARMSTFRTHGRSIAIPLKFNAEFEPTMPPAPQKSRGPYDIRHIEKCFGYGD